MATVAVLSSTRISMTNNRCRLTTPTRRISLVQASSKYRTQGEEETRASPPFLSQEDLKYVAKLGAGSVVGAAAIKYGSIIFPDITRPSIAQAMLMISAPVFLAVLLLIIYSRPTTNS